MTDETRGRTSRLTEETQTTAVAAPEEGATEEQQQKLKQTVTMVATPDRARSTSGSRSIAATSRDASTRSLPR